MKSADNSKAILRKLKKLYPSPETALVHRNPFELIAATILSAQCTDARVNIVTPELFKKYPTPDKMSKAKINDLEELVRTTGFFRSKAKSLSEMSKSLVEKFNGEVPKTMDELTSLRGVGRKTANVVLGNAFGIDVGITVDTHVGRLSRRFKFTKYTDPVKVEQDLMKIVPKIDWTDVSHEMILHGRAICHARNPKCPVCPLKHVCPSYPLV